MKRWMLIGMGALWGCGGSSTNGDGGAGDADAAPPDATPPPISAAVAGDLLAAADPKLEGFDGWPIRFAVVTGGRSGVSCTIEVERLTTQLAAMPGTIENDVCVAIWDGRDAAGAWLRPGTATARVRVSHEGAEVATAEATLEIVRLGIDEIWLTEAEPGARATLIYGQMAGQAGGYYEILHDQPVWRLAPDQTEGPGAVSLEHGSGTPRALPPIWTDLTSPALDAASPDGAEHDTYNLPSAWIHGALVRVEIRFSADVAGEPGGGAPAIATIRLVAPAGLVPDVEPTFQHGGTATLTTIDSPVPAVARYDLSWIWTFQVWNGTSWVAIPGQIRTWHRLYGLVAQPIFDYTDMPHRAWVEIVDKVAEWVDGAASDEPGVTGEIVEGVYWNLGLVYDQENGASAYTDYPYWDWSGATFDVTQFQRRGFGEVINCSDAASIVSTYANMVGADIRYHILERPDGNGFDLNFIRAIGTADFTETPFTGGRGAFRYHAVTGPPDGTFYDATLALDGDGTPTALPATLLLAQGMLPDDYLFDLSSEWSIVGVEMDEKVRLQ